MDYSKFDIIIVGAGMSGCVMAERCAKEGKRVLVLEKRDHIGGNCFDYINEHGILISKYGPHVFRTDSEDVWNYIKKFSKWREYEHKVLANVGGKLVPIPVNLTTINTLFNLDLKNGDEMLEFLNSKKEVFECIDNAEKQVLGLLGREIYELMFKNYTFKQWGKDPTQLDASITARIPVRFGLEDRYYLDEYQYQPEQGFTKIFEKMLLSDLITVKLNIDFFDITNDLGDDKKIIFTGPIDVYFRHKFNKKTKLEYRSLMFKDKLIKKEFFQENAVINFPGYETKYIRTTEHKYISGQKHKWTVVTREYPKKDGLPCYPVINSKNNEKLNKIKSKLEIIKNVVFLGRLGRFAYINMDVAIKESLDLFEQLKRKKWFD